MTTTITARVTKEDKGKFENLCSSIGISSSTAINMFVKATLREQQIPFALKAADPFYSAQNQERLKNNIDEMEKSGGKIHQIKTDD
ncbi:MAG: type II toxin-antitoxin system RelB/DinJ family antitoxin [Bacilli bacterium]